MSQIPPGWATALVQDLARADEQPVLTGPFGTNMGREDFQSQGVPVLTIGCLTEHGVTANKANFVSDDKAEELSRYRLRSGDILFSRMASVGRAGIVPSNLEGALFNYHVMRLRLHSGAYDPELFISYVRGAPEVKAYLNEVNHGATRDGVNTSQLLSMPVIVPPIDEQRRIVPKIDALTAKSRRAKEALDAIPLLLDKLRQSILAAAFRGDLTADWRTAHPDVEPASQLLERIRAERRRRWEEAELAKMKAKGKVPTDDRWKAKYQEPEPVDESGLPELPEGWCWTTLETVAEVDLGRQRAPQYQTGKFSRPYLRVANIKDDRIDLSDINCMDFDDDDFAHYALAPGDILLSEGQSPQLVGQSAIYEGGVDGLCFQKTLHRFRAYNAGPSPRFSQLVFRHYLHSGVFRSIASLTVNIAHLTLVRLKPLHFPLAPKEEQRELVNRAQGALEHVRRLESLCESLREQHKSLESSILAKAFRGELVPQDPNDEPASVLLERIRTESGVQPKQSNRRRKAKTA